MPQIPNTEIESEAVAIVTREKTQWETASVWITEKVAFNMRNLIRQLRKNYWGVFDQQLDPVTGKKKIWVPLTESVVESVVKNIDLDQKDINFRAKKRESIGLTRVVRSIVKNFLDGIFFGEHLDMLERDLAIDGTAVWKTIEAKDENRKQTLQIKKVDLLNCYIDPTAPSIAEAYRFTERALMTPDEIAGMKGWINTKDIEGVTGLSRNDSLLRSIPDTAAKLVDVWELWGYAPNRLMTGNSEDTEDVDLHIVVSGVEAGKPRVHLIENAKKRPYEEAWYTRISGRWYGKGIAEKLLWLQLWINTTVNLRINRQQVAQLGIFKIKKGAGITAQMLSRLVSNGAVTVNNQDDIEQLTVQEPGVTSYRDEESAYQWSQRTTGAFEVAMGEQTPASQTATANAIQNTNAQSQFTLIKEGIGMFLQRWMKRQALPVILKRVKLHEIIRCVGDADELRQLDELIVNKLVADELATINQRAAGGEEAFVDPVQVERARQNALVKLQQTGEDRYIQLLHTLDPSEYDTEVYITNEEIDKGVLSRNLLTLIQLAPEYREELTQDLMDIMGLPFFPKKQQMMGMMQQGMPQEGVMESVTQNPQQVVQQANEVNV
jgi:hypothetical protein